MRFGKLDVCDDDNLDAWKKRRHKEFDNTVRYDDKLPSSDPTETTEGSPETEGNPTENTEGPPKRNGKAAELEARIRSEGDAALTWLYKEEAKLSSGCKDTDWRKELLQALRCEDNKGKPREPDITAPPVSPRRKNQVSAPWSYQSFVDAEPRNFTRGKKRQGTAIAIEKAEPKTREAAPGKSYIEMTPTFCEASLGVNKTIKMGLLDSCAQLSLVGRETLNQMVADGEEVDLHSRDLKIRGIGASEAHEFCNLKVFIMMTRPDGTRFLLETQCEFWIVDSLNESFVLGMDYIARYGIDLYISKRYASMSHKTEGSMAELEIKFPLFFGREWKEEMLRSTYDVTSKARIVVPPRTEGAVSVIITAQASDLPCHDLWLEPIVMCNLGINAFATAAKGIISSNTATIWFANMGDQPVTLERGMKLGKATHLEGSVSVMVTQAVHSTGRRGETKPTSGNIKVTATKAPMKSEGINEVDIFTASVEGMFKAGLDEGITVLPDPNDRPPPEPGEEHRTEDGFDISTEYGENGQPPESILSVLRSNVEAFTDGPPGRVTDGTEIKLETEDDRLTPQALRHQSPRKREAIDETIDQLLEWGIIEESESRVSYPVVIVSQNGKNRFCVDYRSLNQWTKPRFYPMQRSDDVFDALLGKKIFSTLDAARGYHAIPVRKEDRWKTAFLTHRGLYHYVYMPFGLKNAPAVFQEFMDRILGSLRWTSALVYIDDVLIFSDTLEQHAEHLEQLLTTATKAGLKFSKTKSHFAYSSLTMLGRRVSTEGLSILQDKVAAVRDLEPPQTVKDVWHLMGLFGYYRSFIHKFSLIAAPITALTKGVKTGRKPDGSIECAAGSTKITWTDECEKAFQTLKRKLTSPPLLAFPDFTKPFILYVDASHDGMAFALHQKCDVAVANPLVTEDGERDKERIRVGQKADSRWRSALKRTEETPEEENDTDYALTDGILRWQGRICLPENLVSEALADAHDKLGHFGFEKTYARMADQWFRPGLAKAVVEYLASCRICKGAKRSKLRPAGEMSPQRHIQNKSFASIAIDVILGMPEIATNGEKYNACLVICDLFTKAVKLRPTSNKATAEQIAKLILHSVVCQGFLPTTIVSDRDPKYISALWTAIMKSLEMNISIASPYHQQADPAERTIQTVETVMRCYPDGSWLEKLPFVELAINEAKHASTGFAPYDLLYTNRKPPSETLLKQMDDEVPEATQIAQARLKEAMENIKRAQESQKRYYDRRHSTPPELVVGDEVFLLLDLHPVRRLPKTKLAWPKWGPFKVTKIVSKTSVEVDFPSESGIHRIISIQHLERLPPDTHGRPQGQPTAIIEGEEAWDVERIVGRRVFGRRKDVQYLVKWKGYDDGQSTWEFATNLAEDVDENTLQRLITEWEATNATTMNVNVSPTLDISASARKNIRETGPGRFEEKPILFLSRVLRSYEKNYTILELELGAVVWAILKCQRYLDGIPFTVVTDHQPILTVVNSSSKTLTSPRVERWRMLLQPYIGQVTWIHKAGKIHTNVDALSRLTRSTAKDTTEASLGEKEQGQRRTCL